MQFVARNPSGRARRGEVREGRFCSRSCARGKTQPSPMMTRDQAAELRCGDKVRILVAGCGEVGGKGLIRLAPGEIVTVARLDNNGRAEGLAITVYSQSGVVNVFEETDYEGRYPFERIGL